MSFSLSATTICFIACHSGPADHFATFAENLVKKGYTVQICATGPALKKLQDRHIENITLFALENMPEQITAAELAKKCANAAVIITDVGHPFDIPLQKALAIHASNALRFAYYDNPEAYVPGGYSEVAAKVMRVAQRVLFANSHLVKTPLYRTPSQETDLPNQKKIGIGYYPISQAEKIAGRRTSDHKQIRAQFFSQNSLKDEGQKVLIYTGGNNDEYFSKAFPAFLQFLNEASQKHDLSHFIVVLQQHPGAKERNLDVQLIRQWREQHGTQKTIPQLILSTFNSEDAQVLADGIFYYQTSMAPQFILAGIPTIQVGHKIYEDILVKNGLCSIATKVDELMNALTHLQNKSVASDHAAIQQGLGICSDWETRLEQAVQVQYAYP